MPHNERKIVQKEPHERIRISIRVKPLSKEERVVRKKDHYVVYVKDPPRKNRANRAVMRLLSTHFEVPQSAIKIIRGPRSAHKIIELQLNS